MSETPPPGPGEPDEAETPRPAESVGDWIAALGFSQSELEAIYGSAAAAAIASLGAGEDPQTSEQAVERTRAAAESDTTPVRKARNMDDLAQAHEQARLDDATQDRGLRKVLAWWSIGAASSMLLLGTVVFVIYMASQWGEVPLGAIVAYLTSTVVEVLGIVVLVATYLFPKPK